VLFWDAMPERHGFLIYFELFERVAHAYNKSREKFQLATTRIKVAFPEKLVETIGSLM
jgi:hypothetical protein